MMNSTLAPLAFCPPNTTDSDFLPEAPSSPLVEELEQLRRKPGVLECYLLEPGVSVKALSPSPDKELVRKDLPAVDSWAYAELCAFFRSGAHYKRSVRKDEQGELQPALMITRCQGWTVCLVTDPRHVINKSAQRMIKRVISRLKARTMVSSSQNNASHAAS